MQQKSIDAVKEQLKDIIVDELDANIERADICDESSLYDDGLGLDSIAIINLIVFIEKKFAINFEESEISSMMFTSLNALAAFIHEKTSLAEADRYKN
ncbi:MAG TPA: phosphopantetheine-binding protein [Puia sp.]|jgi:acyl carrier protein|nr:phosphopantetheine-binding protein [Puia sp.]